VRCLSCDAYAALVSSYVREDSLAVAIHVAKEWIARQPTGPESWRVLGDLLVRSGRSAEGRRALAVSDSLIGAKAGQDLARKRAAGPGDGH
ncbi:MAG TPA: hypothetical protein VEI47_02880, partial [Gemmatimonadales bacterium]|nr:hypothetical protein [Gemmatimonadales bacterium]